MENTKYGKRREGRWTPIRVKAQDTRANPNSWETHLARKRWGIGLLRALSLRITMMMILLNRVDQCCPTFLIPRAAQWLILKPRATIVSSKQRLSFFEPYELHKCIAGVFNPLTSMKHSPM